MNTQTKILNNAFFLYGLTFSNYFMGLLLYPYLSRVLSVEHFGLIGFSMSFCQIFQVIVEYGFQISTTAQISVKRDDINEIGQIISVMTTCKIVLAVISTVAFVICSFFVQALQGHFIIVFLFFIDSLIKAFLPDAYFRGIEQMKAITTRAVFVKSGIIIINLLFLKGDEGVIIYPLSMIVCDFGALLWAYILIYKDQVRLQKVFITEIIQALKDGFLFFISRISVSINGALGSVFLGYKYLADSFEMGIYSGATRISTAGEQMVPPIGDALYPSMMKKKDYKLFYRFVAFGGIIWLAGCMLVFVIAEPLCMIILGEKYILAGQYLRILCIGVFFGFFSFMFGYPALSPIGKANYANMAIVVSACVNLIICGFLLITNRISVLSISLVFAFSNVVVFICRFTAFMRFRGLTKEE